ncbi:hypothetical protein GE09DRAFT_341320 [Coniochaeta sp. 2T2.1]|nr:hypothetical protein GE09DRAFT_341320 [Coniochaeta sp. 2T2.1]
MCEEINRVLSTGEPVIEKRRKKDRTRLRCNWKDCRYSASLLSELQLHLRQHWKCPKEDCGWDEARDEKEKRRHVWGSHKKWAEQIRYPTIGGKCSVCEKKFTRHDNLVRHIREKHAE